MNFTVSATSMTVILFFNISSGPAMEKERATQSSTPPRIPRTEEPGGLQFLRSQEADITEQLHHHHGSCEVYFCFVPVFVLGGALLDKIE